MLSTAAILGLSSLALTLGAFAHLMRQLGAGDLARALLVAAVTGLALVLAGALLF